MFLNPMVRYLIISLSGAQIGILCEGWGSHPVLPESKEFVPQQLDFLDDGEARKQLDDGKN
jgi:hypothetical protein